MDDAGERGRRWGEWMTAAQRGDARSYRLLLGEIAVTVRRMALRRWGPVDELDDLVQDILLAVHSVRRTYDPARPFMPWLVAIARNRMADAARRRGRRLSREVVVETLPATFWDDGTNLDGGPGDPEMLRRAIAGLPAGQRQAVEMLKLGEMSLKEASAASGQSVPALKVAMHRALRALRAALGREDGK